MIHKDYCSKCKRKNISLIKYSKGTRGNVQYYHCRDCNNERIKAYQKTPAGKIAFNRLQENMRIKYPEKIKARQLVRNAIVSGGIVKPNGCEICENNHRLAAHHSDYSKPLQVTWLCGTCHTNIHRVV